MRGIRIPLLLKMYMSGLIPSIDYELLLYIRFINLMRGKIESYRSITIQEPVYKVCYIANKFREQKIDMPTRGEIGKEIRLARKGLGYTQKSLSEKTKVNKTTISEIENGRFTGSFDIFERVLDGVGAKSTAT